MNCEQIEQTLNALKVNKLGRVRGKGKAMNALYSMHLTALDEVLTKIRLYVGKKPQPTNIEIDKFIYEIQTS